MITDQDLEFLSPRRCLRPPIPEIFFAAHLLDRAVGAHLEGDLSAAGRFIRDANMPEVRAWTESLWGSRRQNTDQEKYHRFRPVSRASPLQARKDRVPLRMPSRNEEAKIIGRCGRHCLFCGIPLIREQIRNAIRKVYPDHLPWGTTNPGQHAAFQCMWLQFDHVTPHSRGGDNSIANVIVTCAPCNYGRGHRTLEELGLIDPRQLPVHKTSWDGLERFVQGDTSRH